MNAPNASPRTLWPYVLFAAAGAFFLGASAVGWNNSLLDDNGFRQTQTAISAYYMVGRPPTLAYETPVLGPPWSLPFEFPLYQWLVAGLVTLLGTPLEQTGRLVSVAFFLLSLVPANALLHRLRLAREYRLMVLSLALVSPFYIFWSRTFLMESTALCFGLSYLAFAVACRERPGLKPALGVLVMGTLAALVKITTFATCFLGVVLILAYTAFHWKTGRRLWAQGLLHAVPVVLALAWTHYADGVKAQNQFGQFLTAQALHEWNFGTLEQRLNPESWAAIGRRLGLMVGHLGMVAVSLVGLFLAGRRWLEVGFCALLAFSGPVIFLNLHVVHEYYPYANGIYVIAAVGIALAALMERGGVYRRGAAYLLVALLAVSAFRYVQYFYPKQSLNRLQEINVAQAARRVTQPAEVLLIVGCDWSPEIPYYGGRRALMIPDWKTVSLRNLPTYLQKLEGIPIGALVIREDTACRFEPGELRRTLAALGLGSDPAYTDGILTVYPRQGRLEPGETASLP
jgi:hypothetical protein